ncbi:MAG: transposase [Syntrophaceae bacterium]
MARPLRIEYPGAIYHITARGNAREDIFLDDHDRLDLLALLKGICDDCHWICHAYCLMTNHYHLLIETVEGNLSQGMRQLNGIYTQNFNRRHGRTGHVFQGRFKAIVVDKDAYLLTLCRYIVLNPTKAGLVASPADWRWSSYRSTAGIDKKDSLVFTDWILSQFGASVPAARRAYRKFVLSEDDLITPWKALQGGLYLGDSTFIENLKEILRGKSQFKEFPRTQRYAARPTLAGIIGDASLQALDPAIIYTAYQDFGYTLKEIGDHVGLHYSTISRMIKRQKQELVSGKRGRAKNKT